MNVPKHVRMNVSETGTFADRSDPSMRSATVETLSIMTEQNWSLAPFADCEIDSAGRAWHERNHRRLAALADDPQRAMPTIEAEITNVGFARLAHPQPVQPQQDCEC